MRARYEYQLRLKAVGAEEARSIVADLRRLFGKENVRCKDDECIVVVTTLTSEAALDAIRIFVKKYPKVSLTDAVKLN